MVKQNKQKIFVPKKVKGGAVLGKDGDTWFAVKVTGFSNVELRSIKKYLGEQCKEYFVQDEADVENY